MTPDYHSDFYPEGRGKSLGTVRPITHLSGVYMNEQDENVLLQGYLKCPAIATKGNSSSFCVKISHTKNFHVGKKNPNLGDGVTFFL